MRWVAWRQGSVFLLVMAFSSQAMEAASQAARVFAGGVMPALLPMMVLCRLLPAPPITNVPHGVAIPARCFFLCLRLAGQRAAGARPLGRGRVGARRAGAPLLAACGVMEAPMFFTGTLAQWTGLRAGCWVLLLCHWTGALAAAGVVRLAARKQPACRTEPRHRRLLPRRAPPPPEAV